MKNANKDKTLHYKYWIGILIFIVITLFTIKIGDNTELNQLLSFALTLSSLTLAILAIFLSFTSATILERTSEKISSSTHDIKDSSAKISNALSIIERVERGVNSVEEKFNNYEKTGKLHNNEKDKAESKNTTKISSEFALNFIEASTPRGCEVLLIATLSHRYSIPFTFPDTLGEKNHHYAFGFMKAAEAAGLLTVKSNNHGQIVIESINPTITEHIEDKVIENNNESYDFFLAEDASPESVKNLVYSDYLNIFKYFNAMSDVKDPRTKSL